MSCVSHKPNWRHPETDEAEPRWTHVDTTSEVWDLRSGKTVMPLAAHGKQAENDSVQVASIPGTHSVKESSRQGGGNPTGSLNM